MSCPNKSSKEWKKLVDTVGENAAYGYFALDPELSNVDQFLKEAERSKNKIKFNFASGNKSKNSNYYSNILEKINTANNPQTFSPEFKKLIADGKVLNPNIEYIGTVTDNGLLNKMRFYLKKNSEQVIKEAADELYKDLSDTDTLIPEFSKIPVTKQQYIDFRTKQSQYYKDLGKLQELILTYPIMSNLHPEYTKVKSETEKLLLAVNSFRELQAMYSKEQAILFNIDNYAFALEDATFPEKLMNLLGIDALDEGSKTKYDFQVQVKSDTLAVRSIMDMIVDHGDHIYSIYDFKAGRKFAELINSTLFNQFARQRSIDITSNSQDLARIQIMLEAILVRINDPQARFYDLAALWLPDADALRRPGSLFHVGNVQDYLMLIKDTLYNHPEYKDKIRTLENLDPGLFNYRNYTSISPKVRELIKKNPTSLHQTLLDDIVSEIIHLQSYSKFADPTHKAKVEQRIRNLYDTYNQVKPDNLVKTPGGQMSLKNVKDLSWGELNLGSNYNIKNPVISAAMELLHEQYLKVSAEFQQKEKVFKVIQKNVFTEYAKNRNKGAYDTIRNLPADAFTELSPTLRKLLGTIDYDALNGWVYVYKKDTNRGTTRQLLATTEEELIANAKGNPKYAYILNESGKVKPPFLNMMRFMNDMYESVWDPKREDSLWNQVVSYKEKKNGEKIPVIFGEEINSGDFRSKSPYVHEKGDFARVPKLPEEIKFFEGLKKSTSGFFKRYFTNFYEFAFYERGNSNEFIPLNGIPSAYNNDPNEYSISLEHQFNSFYSNAMSKKHLTSAYGFIEAIKLVNFDNDKKKSLLPNVDKFLSAQQEMALRKRKPLMVNTFSRGLPFNFGYNAPVDPNDPEGKQVFVRNTQNFNFGKMLQSFGKLTGFMRLGFNFPGGIKNTIGISLSSFSEASKQSILQRFYNDPQATRFVKDFTTMGVSEFTLAFGPAMKMQLDAMTGNLESNKAWTLMKKFAYIPSISPLRPETKNYITKELQLLGIDMAMLPYSTMEEVLVAMFFIAQMNHIKVEQGPKKGKSLWDMYHKKTMKDPLTGVEYTDYIYEGEDTGNPYLRGVIRDSEGNMTNMYGLTNKEVMVMHALYEEKQGGFSDLDRTILESGIFGALFIQFRRHIPSILRHGLQSYGPSYIKGRYQKVEDKDEKGNIIYEFSAKQVEGKWLTVLGVLLHYTGIASSKSIGKIKPIAGFIDDVFPKSLDAYAYSKLDQGQLENLIDAGVTISVWALMKIFSYFAMGGRDKDDRLVKLADKILMQIWQQWSLIETINDITDKPAAYQTIVALSNGTYALSASVLFYGFDNIDIFDPYIDESDYETKEDKFRGVTELENNIPVFTSLRSGYRLYEDFVNPNEE